MLKVHLIQALGISHLLQPPLTLLLARPRGLKLGAALAPQSPMARLVLHNMAVAAVGLPTSLGLVLASYPAETLRPGAARSVALLICTFWCWRLYRQLFVLGPLWPKTGRMVRSLHPLLVAIFTAQGPGLALLLLG